jgi:hypothetical protein
MRVEDLQPVPVSARHDPRVDLPSMRQMASAVDTAGPDALSGDDVESIIGLLCGAYPHETPTASQLVANPNLPWIRAGHQEVIAFARQLLHNYRIRTNRR